jgi:hypothetical protein
VSQLTSRRDRSSGLQLEDRRSMEEHEETGNRHGGASARKFPVEQHEQLGKLQLTRRPAGRVQTMRPARFDGSGEGLCPQGFQRCLSIPSVARTYVPPSHLNPIKTRAYNLVMTVPPCVQMDVLIQPAVRARK